MEAATVSRPTGFTSFVTPNNATTTTTIITNTSTTAVESSTSDNALPSTTVGPGRPTPPLLISKIKNLTEEDFVATTPASSERMTEIAEGEDSWRAYYEHPLTAATTAMLNINGAGEEQNPGIGLLYEYYKFPPLEKGDKLPLKYGGQIPDIWSSSTGVVVPSSSPVAPATPTVIGIDPSSVGGGGGVVTTTITPASTTSTPNSSLKEGTNNGTGGVVVVENGESAAGPNVVLPPPHHAEAATTGVVIYLNHSGATSPDANDAAAVAAVAAASATTTSTASSSAGVGVVDGNVIIKLEPEDLTNSRESPCDQAEILSRETKSNNANGGECVVVSIKQEPQDSPGTSSNCTDGGAPLTSPSTPRTPSTPVDQPDPIKVRQDMAFPVQAFTMATVTYDHHVSAPNAPQYSVLPAAQPQFTATSTTGNLRQAAPSYVVATDYYRDYVTATTGPPTSGNSASATNGTDYYQTVRQQLSYGDTQENVAFVERYMRQNNNSNNYKTSAGLTVDLPSPDSGIGEAAITPRDSAGLPQIFDYSDLSQNQMVTTDPTPVVSRAAPNNTSATRRPWHDFSRSSEAEKIQIPKIFSNVGFRYYLESPISTSQRREDDRITYINKGQFYGITLEYIPDPDKPLKSQTVKSVVLLVFREEKSPEDEMKAWQFWHSRQHSVKQRILDADTKNSTGLVGCIEEVTHNAIAVYWNPLESPAKINVAVQCLSTDFSNQKGVKGLPLHLQIDTYEDVREPEPVPPIHRGYCQIKVFCDKGAERKTRDEERRAAKRKLTVTGRKKMDELYHPPCDRSEFYAMSDLLKPPMLFSPTEDLDKFPRISDQQSLLHSAPPKQECTNTTEPPMSFKPRTIDCDDIQDELMLCSLRGSPHYTVEYFDGSGDKKSTEGILESSPEPVFTVPPLKKTKVAPPSDRVMLYIRQDEEEVYTPLHLVPPSLVGLANAIENKYKINASDLKHLYKRSKKGITVRMDDEMIRHYCNEDTFIISFNKLEDGYEVILNEL